jgi:hypothetical protein
MGGNPFRHLVQVAAKYQDLTAAADTALDPFPTLLMSVAAAPMYFPVFLCGHRASRNTDDVRLTGSADTLVVSATNK